MMCFLAAGILAAGPPPMAAARTAVQVEATEDQVTIRNGRIAVRYNLESLTYDIVEGEGDLLVEGAQVAALSHLLVSAHKWPARDLVLGGWTEEPLVDALGRGRKLTITMGGRPDYPTFTHWITLYDSLDCITTGVTLSNLTGRTMSVGAIYPLHAGPPEGSLHFGANRDLRVLTNGAINYLDFIAPILPGTAGTISNWSTLIYNQNEHRSLAAGFLTFDRAQPVVYNGPAHTLPGQQEFHCACEYDPAKTLAPGESLASEVLVLDASQPTPHDALETYAERIAAWQGIVPWQQRHPEIGIPVGWNSWSGGGSSGGYGTDINEEIIVDNMDFADRELRRWGMNYFQIDDGWEVAVGDWEVNKERFPDHGDLNGIAWLMQRARGLGFIPGLWIQAFGAEAGAAILDEHPEWFADHLLPDPSGANGKILDLSNPEALAYLSDLIGTLQDWGAAWVKLDFAYEAYLSTNWDDETLTRGEFYRQGVRTVRDALADDTFFLNVAVVGFNYDLVDGMRLTLDTMPVWDGESPKDPVGNQGLKPGYRDAVRRYYLNGRVWVNHPDLIFFRAHRDSSYPPLTLDESRVFASAVALAGGLVKLGDRLVDLTPDQVDSIRKIIPPHDAGGRPLDLFEKEFPELWLLRLEQFAEPYLVAGFLNWGSNTDLTTLPHRDLPDAARVIALDLEGAGVDTSVGYLGWEFWEEKFLGVYRGEVALHVPAHRAQVVALRPLLGRPQFLGTNRHVLGGVGVIRDIVWDADTLTLRGWQEGSVGTDFAPFRHHLAFFVPSGWSYDGVAVEPPAGCEATVIDYRLTPVDGGRVLEIWLEVQDLDGMAPGDQFGTLEWDLTFHRS